MRTFMVAPLAMTALVLGGLAHAGDLESGPKLGSRTAAFNVKDITGEYQGKYL